MNQGKSIFSQIMDFLPRHKFRQCVNRYGGNYRVRSFTCFDQFLCMAFAQLTYRESLRFFKQKTAYVIVCGDWSSDVCFFRSRSEERRVGKDWYGVDLGGRRIIKKKA